MKPDGDVWWEGMTEEDPPTVLYPFLFYFRFLEAVFNGLFLDQYVDDELDYLFFVDFFSILILVDVFILLISFQYTERYSQLIRNTGFIISTILLRLSFSTTGLSSIILLISGILFGLIILSIYNQMEKQPKQL